MEEERVLIMGAAGRDFHDFLTEFKDSSNHRVVGFTMAEGQNLGETDEKMRKFPEELAGERYDSDIPVFREENLEKVVRDEEVDQVIFSYSDVSHTDVMHFASRAVSSGAGFRILGADDVMLDSDKPVVAVDAVRTGCGKSQLTRRAADILESHGRDVVIVREPMPYGDLVEQEVMRFENEEDLERYEVTVEEREEYEQHLDEGNVVFAGVNYQKILRAAEKEADVILWDGGNNELPFFRPDLHLVLVDPLRPGDELSYHPGESNLRMADCVVVNKENTAEKTSVEQVLKNVREANPEAEIIHADSVVSVERGEELEDMKVLVVEDGPTLTHGGTSFGAGLLAARKYGAEPVEPRDSAKGSLKKVFKKYENLGTVLPAMGYSKKQLEDLEKSINSSECDAVLLGTPADLRNVIEIDKPVYRARYRIEEKDGRLEEILKEVM